jgi:hypothetical protein
MMRDFVVSLGDDWFVFRYEDMVNKQFDGLNAHLGFSISPNAEVPSGTGKQKVVRKKATGDWRHWFTEADVEFLKPAYTPYMELIGYDIDDWLLSPEAVIEPQYSSMYMQGLIARKRKYHPFGALMKCLK